MAEGYWRYIDKNPTTGKKYYEWVRGTKPSQPQDKILPPEKKPSQPNTHAGHVGEALDKDSEDREEEWKKERGIDQLKNSNPQE